MESCVVPLSFTRLLFGMGSWSTWYLYLLYGVFSGVWGLQVESAMNDCTSLSYYWYARDMEKGCESFEALYVLTGVVTYVLFGLDP